MSAGDLLFGIHAVEAALQHDAANIVELFIEAGSHNARLKELSERAREAGVKPHARDRAALDRMTGGARHQGAVARYRTPPPRGEAELAALVEAAGRDALLLVL
ncbi:MAG TPA: RNA methyltransferase substrate-binding domain-containing protein, partial [Rhodanobacteraceae bacterium]|nr:RNA methyltransferase substrate-binding domain-containing protein [Rhodanobacteraceae bacterium]